MGYIRVSWPESQRIMDLDDEELEDLGIELGEGCSFFVPEESVEELAEEYGIYV